MKLAIAGKGGSGKTTIGGTLARLLARGGRRVLALDDDSNPNLAMTLGVPRDHLDDLPSLDVGLLQYADGDVWLADSVPGIVRRYGIDGADGVRLLIAAHPREAGAGCLSLLHVTARTIVREAPDGPDDVCLLDTEASLEHFSRATTLHTRLLLCVVEASSKSLLTAAKMARLSADMVRLRDDLGPRRTAIIANKVRDEHELRQIRDFAERHELEVEAVVPWDATLHEAERAGVAPLDYAPDTPAVRAIRDLAGVISSAAPSSMATSPP